MIIYFSGTGNSKYVADRFSKSLNEKSLSLNTFIKENKIIDIDEKEELLIIVVPTYAWRIPNLVRDYILKLKKQDIPCYFIMTCGNEIGNSKKYNELLAKEMNYKYMGTAKVVMPENYIALFEVPDNEESIKIINESENKIDSLIEKVKSRKTLNEDKVNPLDKFKSSVVHSLFYKFIVKDKKFIANDSCISCGKCVKVCPLNNVAMLDNKISWHGNCTHCMACICYCPVQAIEYGKGTKDKSRYICPKSI